MKNVQRDQFCDDHPSDYDAGMELVCNLMKLCISIPKRDVAADLGQHSIAEWRSN